MRSVGVRVELIDRDSMVRGSPALRFGDDEHVEGLFVPEGGYVDDPVHATADVARAAAAEGVSFALDTRLTEVLTGWSHDRLEVRGARTHRGETFESPVVVNCVGPHSGWLNLVARTPLALTTAPLRQVVVDGRAPSLPSLPGPLPVIADLVHGFYLRPDPERVRVGAVWPQDETDFLTDPDAADPLVEPGVIATRLAAARPGTRGVRAARAGRRVRRHRPGLVSDR